MTLAQLLLSDMNHYVDSGGKVNRQFVRDNIGSICHERQSTRTLSGGKVCYECAMGFLREGKLKLHNYQ